MFCWDFIWLHWMSIHLALFFASLSLVLIHHFCDHKDRVTSLVQICGAFVLAIYPVVIPMLYNAKPFFTSVKTLSHTLDFCRLSVLPGKMSIMLLRLETGRNTCTTKSE